MARDIITTAAETLNDLIQTIAAFPPDKFNTIPFEGSWTAAQVSDHILKSVIGIEQLLHTRTKPTSRPVDQKVDSIREVFLDFTIKMKSPDFVLPRNEPIEKEQMLSDWEKTKVKLMESIQKLDLSATCTAFELPGSGEFTRSEWIWFAIFHMLRHTYQLKNIYEVLVNEKQIAV